MFFIYELGVGEVSQGGSVEPHAEVRAEHALAVQLLYARERVG